MTDQRRWILADASTAGAIRFGWAVPGGRRVESARSFASDEYPTFTDAVLAYERAEGIPLRGAAFALAVPAPPTGDAIPVSRSRWTISRSGLHAMFGGSVAIVNDVAATAWSLLGDGAHKLESLGGGSRPDFTQAGRWILVLLEDGVNAASLDVGEDGRCSVIDGEVGNAGFCPGDDREDGLMRQLRGLRAHVSWEQALNAGWQEPHAGAADRAAWAGMAGAFVGDVVMQLGGWSGVILCGRHAAALREPALQQVFTRRMVDKGRYGRFVAGACRYLMPSRDPMDGVLALMRARHAERLTMAA